MFQKVVRGVNNIDDNVEDIADDVRKLAAQYPSVNVGDILGPLYTFSELKNNLKDFPASTCTSAEGEKEFEKLRKKIIYDHVVNYMQKNMKGEQTTSLEARCAAISLY